MFRRVDTVAGILAVAFHALVAFIIVSMPPPKARSSSTIEVDIKKIPPPPEPVTPPKPPEPEPEKKPIPRVKQAPAPTPAPTPPKDVPPPPEPVKQIYEVKETVEGESNVAIQKGDNGNVYANPNEKGKGAPQQGGGTPGPPPPKGYSPVSAIYIKSLPDIDGEACAKMVQYPAEAEAQGIEGDVLLNVALEDTGKVHSVTVVKGLGHGLDEAAMNALKHKCHFTPAIGTDGKPKQYEIKGYKWTFELPR